MSTLLQGKQKPGAPMAQLAGKYLSFFLAKEEYGIQILLDWEGALLASPFSLSEGAANVVLFDTEGRIAWRFVGALGDTGESSFYRALRGLLREAP